jgi:hypothetical protein
MTARLIRIEAAVRKTFLPISSLQAANARRKQSAHSRTKLGGAAIGVIDRGDFAFRSEGVE